MKQTSGIRTEFKFGARRGTRTPTPYGIRPSIVLRPFEFMHDSRSLLKSTGA